MKTMKAYFSSSLVYAIIAMVFGVFYREFTKFNGFTEPTKLSLIHPHYFMLGFVFFLLLLILQKQFQFSNEKTKKIVLTYHIGLNIATSIFLARGVMQVLGVVTNKAIDASLSGIAGIGHILLGVSMVMLLLQVGKSIKE